MPNTPQLNYRTHARKRYQRGNPYIQNTQIPSKLRRDTSTVTVISMHSIWSETFIESAISPTLANHDFIVLRERYSLYLTSMPENLLHPVRRFLTRSMPRRSQLPLRGVRQLLARMMHQYPFAR